MRKTLVVIQFAASVFLIISALVISGQLGFMTKGDLGFDQEHLLFVRMRGGFLEDYQNIKGQLLQNSRCDLGERRLATQVNSLGFQ